MKLGPALPARLLVNDTHGYILVISWTVKEVGGNVFLVAVDLGR